jgi:hypothetical protein
MSLVPSERPKALTRIIISGILGSFFGAIFTFNTCFYFGDFRVSIITGLLTLIYIYFFIKNFLKLGC